MRNKVSEMGPLFQEALAQDLDRTTKQLLDSADRLSWTDDMTVGSIDRWIETIDAARGRLQAARARRQWGVSA